ncbi:Bax inhibitor-1/YccA family protein [Algoriphagus lacus]|uniref:Bax inhibitor-1/YccA family protein n=1 Tax=Algoriphagus lacus TaxID=2056311 RepID=A0A418PV70_9BACT|nr:Bax inhibitor-1/YccA family protein [Algoriphagus lacus]RIW17491.1 Bax inhibitor-1/YccA family protein [Algoriphagus lacus]
MALFKSGNPALTKDTFNDLEKVVQGDENIMTLQGTVNKTGLLLLAVIVPALYTWNLFTTTLDFATITPYLWTGTIGGLILAFIIVFNMDWSPFLAPVYAILQGLCLGGFSAAINHNFPGIVMQALLLTFGICMVLLIIYKLKIIKPTENFKLIVASATGGLAMYYLVNIGLSFAGVELPFIHENNTGGIIFSLFAVVLASMNLVVDFDFIEQGVEGRAPKYMEWYGAFGLMVTIIWLYVEILRLLAKSRKK